MSRPVIPMPAGSTFHDWTVTGPAQRQMQHGVLRLHYPCRCRCGYVALVAGHCLRRGKSKGCTACRRRRS